MGKSNRIKTNRANEKFASTSQVKAKQKKGMPNWAMSLIAIVITVAVVLTVVFTLLIENNVFLRMRTAVSSEHFKVNGSMMSYFYNLQYSNFQQTYSSLLSSFSIDTSKPLDKQTFGVAATEGGTANELYYLGAFEGTWHDYFVNLTEEEVRKTLLYCEEAYKLEIKLEDADYEAIDSAIENIKMIATVYNYPTVASYLATSYGEGVSLGDVRKAMELTSLAEKCSAYLSDKLVGDITSDRINGEYDENSKDYDIIDYLSYTFTVKYTDVAKEVLGSDYTADELSSNQDEVLEAYRAKIEENKNFAKELEAAKTIEEFEEIALGHIAKSTFNNNLDGETGFTEDDKFTLDEENEYYDAEKEDKGYADYKNAFHAAIIAQIAKDVVADKEAATIEKTSADDKHTIKVGDMEVAMTENAANIYSEVIEDTFDDVLEDRESLTIEKTTFIDDEDEEDESLYDWAFENKANATKTFEDGDGADDAEVTVDKESFTAQVCMIKNAKYKDTEKTKNFSYAVYSTEEDAEAAIAALKEKGELSDDIFEEYLHGDTKATNHSSAEDYSENLSSPSEIDKWLFDDARKIGDLTATPIEMSDSSSSTKYYYVVYYSGDGVENWYNSVKSVLFQEDFEAYYTAMGDTHTITINEKVTKKAKQTILHDDSHDH